MTGEFCGARTDLSQIPSTENTVTILWGYKGRGVKLLHSPLFSAKLRTPGANLQSSTCIQVAAYMKNNKEKRRIEHCNILWPLLEQRVIEKDSNFDGQNTWFDDANRRPSSDKYPSSLTSVIYAFKMLIQYRAEHE
jgi:hypothetical protein